MISSFSKYYGSIVWAILMVAMLFLAVGFWQSCSSGNGNWHGDEYVIERFNSASMQQYYADAGYEFFTSKKKDQQTIRDLSCVKKTGELSTWMGLLLQPNGIEVVSVCSAHRFIEAYEATIYCGWLGLQLKRLEPMKRRYVCYKGP